MTPTLTTVSLNLSGVGKQVFYLSRYLAKNPDITTAMVEVACHIIPRKSTTQSDSSGLGVPVSPVCTSVHLDKINDPPLEALFRLENRLRQVDELDVAILRGIAGKVAFEKLSESLFLSQSAFQYRLRKLYALMDVKNRAELEAVIIPYL